MPNKQRVNVRNPADFDSRVQRSRMALARALFELIQEDGGRFKDITVQEILARAGIGRTTFYSHFRSKEDVLHSTYETVFSSLQASFEQNAGADRRLFPVREFVEHVDRSRPLMKAFRQAGIVEDWKSQVVSYAAGMIERRIRDLQLTPAVRPKLAARMLAAALVESIDWWFDHDSVASGEIDAAFDFLARTVGL